MPSIKQDQQTTNKLLFTFAATQYPEFREELLKLKADINASDEYHQTPLVWALEMARYFDKDKIENNQVIPYVEFLVANGARVKLSNTEISPLLSAAALTNSATVLFLLESGCDINAVDSRGRNVLFFAQNKEIARLLILKGVNINSKDDEGYPSVLMNKSIIDLEMLQFMVENKFDLHMYEPKFGSLLHTFYDKLDIIDYLLDQGVDPNLKSELDGPALYAIAQNYQENEAFHKKIVLRLFEKTTY